MYIKHYDKEGYLAISIYTDNTPITIIPSEEDAETYHVMMAKTALSGSVDLDEAEDMLDDLFSALCIEQTGCDLTQEDN